MAAILLTAIVCLLMGGLIGWYLTYQYVYFPYRITREKEDIACFLEKKKYYQLNQNEEMIAETVQSYGKKFIDFLPESFQAFEEKELVAIADLLTRRENQKIRPWYALGSCTYSTILESSPQVVDYVDDYVSEETFHSGIYKNLQALAV